MSRLISRAVSLDATPRGTRVDSFVTRLLEKQRCIDEGRTPTHDQFVSGTLSNPWQIGKETLSCSLNGKCRSPITNAEIAASRKQRLLWRLALHNIGTHLRARSDNGVSPIAASGAIDFPFQTFFDVHCADPAAQNGSLAGKPNGSHATEHR